MECGETSKENTNTVMQEEERIVGGPFRSLDTIRGDSTVGAQASHVTIKFDEPQARSRLNATGDSPAHDKMSTDMSTL